MLKDDLELQVALRIELGDQESVFLFPSACTALGGHVYIRDRPAVDRVGDLDIVVSQIYNRAVNLVLAGDLAGRA